MPANYNQVTNTVTIKVPIYAAQLLRVFLTNGNVPYWNERFNQNENRQEFVRSLDTVLVECGVYLDRLERAQLYGEYTEYP